MSRIVARGYCQGDEKEFHGKAAELLKMAGGNLYYLLNRGYPVKGASVFVGNHYLLSERQRLALVRAVSPAASIRRRREKECKALPDGADVHIDGFNTVITLEVALSGSTLLRCMDGCIRDLAGLRGTYRLIDKTETALMRIGEALEEKGAGRAIFYLDAPVSNSGRLKEEMMRVMAPFPFQTEVEVIHDVDRKLETMDHVITGDAIILDKCKSWINLAGTIMEQTMEPYPYVDLHDVKE